MRPSAWGNYPKFFRVAQNLPFPILRLSQCCALHQRELGTLSLIYINKGKSVLGIKGRNEAFPMFYAMLVCFDLQHQIFRSGIRYFGWKIKSL